MKKKNIFLALAAFASLSLFACDNNNANTPEQKFVKDRGVVDTSESNITIPEELIKPVEPTPTEGEEIISFEGEGVIETNAGTGISEKADDGGEVLFASANIGYEFVGWYKGDKLLSTNTSYKTKKDETGVQAKYKIKKEFENIDFESTATECTLISVKENCPVDFIIPEGVTKIKAYAFMNSNIPFVTIPSTIKVIEEGAFNETNIIVMTFKAIPEIIGYSSAYKLKAVYLPSSLGEEFNSSDFVGHFNEDANVNSVEQKPDFVINGNYIFVEDEGTWVLVAYGGNEEDIVLPEATDKIQNYCIADEVFSFNYSIKSVKFSSAVMAVSNKLFYYCANLKTVEFAEGMTFIGEYAFANCSALEDVIIPDSVTDIYTMAFYNCRNLTSVTLGKNIESIGNRAFDYCYGLSYVYNLSTKLEIEKYSSGNGSVAYYATTVETAKPQELPYGTKNNFKYIIDTEKNEVMLTTYIGEEKNVVIPSFNGKKIHLSSNLFYSNEVIETVEVNDDVISVGELCFYSCDKLKEFSGKNVESVGSNAFRYCEALTKVSLPKVKAIPEYLCSCCTALTSLDISSAETIGYSAFYRCSSLYQITLPATLTTIETGYDDTFKDCTGLVEIINYSNLSINKGYTDNGRIGYYAKNIITDPADSIIKIEGDFITCTVDETKILLGITDKTKKVLEIPADIDYVNNGILAGSQVEELTIHYLPDYFGSYFSANSYSDVGRYCPSTLKKVTLGEGITEIGYYAFGYCENIETLVLNKNITKMNDSFYQTNIKNVYYDGTIDDWCNIELNSQDSTPLRMGNGTFYFKDGNNYKEITTLTLSSTYTTVPSYHFVGLGFDTVVLPDTITSISDYAFTNCKNLETINIPSGVTSIGNYAFSGCTSLKAINLPNSLTSIGYYAFQQAGLEAITLPESIESLGFACFAENIQLKSIAIPGTVEEIPENICHYCTNLLSVNIKEGVKSVGRGAFEYCRSLYTLALPTTLETIGNDAFAYCENLEDVLLENTKVTTIGEAAFANCYNLTNLNFPQTLTSIGSTSFDNCDKLALTTYKNGCYFGTPENPYRWLIKGRNKNIQECVVHPNCEKIYNGAFTSCSVLKKLVIPATCTDFKGCLNRDNVIEYVELPYVGNSYFGTMLFNLSNNNYLPSTLKTVVINGGALGANAFTGCKTITNIVLSDNVTEIGNSSFENSSITEFVASANLVKIGSKAFYNCPSLAKVDLSNMNWTSSAFGTQVFQSCSALNEVILPENMEEMPGSMFRDCRVLKAINLPDSLTKIGAYAFYQSGLESIDLNNVNYINNYAFSSTSLTSIELTSKVTTYGTYIFQSCPLESVTLTGVKKLGEYMFKNCSKLENITIPTTLTEIPAGAFQNSGIKSFDFSKIASLKTYSFSGTKLETVTLPSTITSMESYVFQSCSVLTEATINCETLGTHAFDSCKKLAKVVFGNKNKIIGNYAFYYCTALTDLTLSPNTQNIYGYAFNHCGLTSFVFPSYRSNGYDAFAGVDMYAFQGCPLSIIYVKGDKDAFERGKTNGGFVNTYNSNREFYARATYFYSETEPTDLEDTYWHYDEDGNIVVWPKPTEQE